MTSMSINPWIKIDPDKIYGTKITYVESDFDGSTDIPEKKTLQILRDLKRYPLTEEKNTKTLRKYVRLTNGQYSDAVAEAYANAFADTKSRDLFSIFAPYSIGRSHLIIDNIYSRRGVNFESKKFRYEPSTCKSKSKGKSKSKRNKRDKRNKRNKSKKALKKFLSILRNK